MLHQVFDGFVDESPVSVMFRGILENIFSSERIDAIFEEHAEKQFSGELAFSTSCYPKTHLTVKPCLGHPLCGNIRENLIGVDVVAALADDIAVQMLDLAPFHGATGACFPLRSLRRSSCVTGFARKGRW